MFPQNESTLDRGIRAILGIVLMFAWYSAWVSGTMGFIVLVLGVVFLLTGLIGWCPIYSLFRMGTYKA